MLRRQMSQSFHPVLGLFLSVASVVIFPEPCSDYIEFPYRAGHLTVSYSPRESPRGTLEPFLLSAIILGVP